MLDCWVMQFVSKQTTTEAKDKHIYLLQYTGRAKLNGAILHFCL